MKIRHFAVTHPGKRRQESEDSYLVDEELNLYLVSDGQTHPFGKACSELACNLVRDYIGARASLLEKHRQHPTPENRLAISEMIRSAVQQASVSVSAQAENNPERKGVFATLALALVNGGHLFTPAIGDSRAYGVRDGKFYPRTQDHTLRAAMLADKRPSEEVEKVPFRDNLYAAIGYQYTRLNVEVRPVFPGERILLCTDGLSDYFPSAEFESAFATHPSPRLAQALQDHALTSGGKDNITALVLEFQEESQKRPSPDKSVPDQLEALRSAVIFRHLDDASLERLLSLTHVRTYQPDEVIMTKGMFNTEMYILLQGTARIDVGTPGAGYLEGKGAILGEMSLFDPAPVSAHVTAKDRTTVLVLNQFSLFEAMRKDPLFAARFELGLLQAVIQRLRDRTVPAEERDQRTRTATTITIFD